MTKRSISLAISDPARPGTVLIVQRPDDDDDLPGVWGLPASSLVGAETWHAAGERTARDKLGIEITLGALLAEGAAERAAYTLHMRLFTARIARGTPHVPQAAAGITQYQAWRWGSADDLRPAAARGSLCSRLYLGSA
jgi:8-oxo-dGTP diphosphatase